MELTACGGGRAHCQLVLYVGADFHDQNLHLVEESLVAEVGVVRGPTGKPLRAQQVPL